MTRDERRVQRTMAAIDGARAFSPKVLSEVYGDKARLCFYCGRDGRRITRDHVLPIHLGGQTTVGNVVPACSQCNGFKAALSPNTWFTNHPRYAFYFLKYATRADEPLREIARRHAKKYADQEIVNGSLWGDAEW